MIDKNLIGHKGCTGWNYPSIVKCLWLFTRFCLDEISSQDVLIPVKKTGMKFHSGMKRKKKSCFENFCSLKKKGPYPSFLSEQKFSKQYFQKTAFVIISLKFWNNQWNSRKNFIIVNMLGLHIWNSKLTRKNREKW